MGLPGYYTETAIPAASRTLRNAIDCCGIGLHSGRDTRLVLKPARAGHGIVFRRVDLGIDIPAQHDCVSDTRLCTRLAAPGFPDASIGTVEHIMAALAAAGVDNVLVEVDGPEIPIFDGSAAPFVFLIDCAGVVDLPVAREMIEIMRPVLVSDGAASASFEPLPPGRSWLGLDIAMSIDFAAGAIGQQSFDPARVRGQLPRRSGKQPGPSCRHRRSSSCGPRASRSVAASTTPSSWTAMMC